MNLSSREKKSFQSQVKDFFLVPLVFAGHHRTYTRCEYQHCFPISMPNSGKLIDLSFYREKKNLRLLA